MTPAPPYPEGMDGEEHVCPVCGQPVGTVVRRYKTLGAWVPLWVGGPCHNPECSAYVYDGTEQPAQEPEPKPGESATKKT